MDIAYFIRGFLRQPNASRAREYLGIGGGSGVVTEDDLSFSDVTTANSTSAKHGLLPKLSGNAGDVFKGDGTFGAAAGGGDVTGPAVSVDSNVALFNGATGKIIKDTGIASTQIPTQAENDALAGTNGVPSAANPYVTDSDPRNTNARTAVPQDGIDTSAIHDNVAGEIAAIALKATPVSGDLLVIEDSAAANAKKSISIGTLPVTAITQLTSDVTAGPGSGSQAATIANNAVSYAKMQDVSAASRLLGRGSAAGAGDPEEIILGTNLSMAGTTLNATGGGGGSATTVEPNLGAAAWTGKFTITDAAIGAASKVLCWQAPGPYTGKGTRGDEALMQPVSVVAVEPAVGSAVVYWQTPPYLTMRRTVEECRTNPVGATFDRLSNQRWPDEFTPTRLGKVSGNVKFSYMVLA